MAYTKQGFYAGQPLKASQLELMEEGIIEAQNQTTPVIQNIKDAEGRYSIITLEDDSKKNEAFGRANFSGGHKTKTYQKDTLGFGAGVISGRKETETSITYRPLDGVNMPMTIQSFNDFYWDNNTNTPKNGGRGKDANDNILDNSGRTYNDSYGTCITFGQSTINAGRAALVSGENNANEAAWALMHGRYNWNKADGECSDIGGFWNTNNGAYNTMRGRFNTSYNETDNQDFSHITLLGDGLKATNDYCTIVGLNGGNKQLGGVRLLFGVATGEGNQGFEVYEGGRVRVLRAPSYDTEVARLKEIRDLELNVANQVDPLRTKVTELETKVNNSGNSGSKTYIHNMRFDWTTDQLDVSGEFYRWSIESLTGKSKYKIPFTYVAGKGILLGDFSWESENPNIHEFGLQPEVFEPTSAFMADMSKIVLLPKIEVVCEHDDMYMHRLVYLTKLEDVDLTNINNFYDYVTEA